VSGGAKEVNGGELSSLLETSETGQLGQPSPTKKMDQNASPTKSQKKQTTTHERCVVGKNKVDRDRPPPGPCLRTEELFGD